MAEDELTLDLALKKKKKKKKFPPLDSLEPTNTAEANDAPSEETTVDEANENVAEVVAKEKDTDSQLDLDDFSSMKKKKKKKKKFDMDGKEEGKQNSNNTDGVQEDGSEKPEDVDTSAVDELDLTFSKSKKKKPRRKQINLDELELQNDSKDMTVDSDDDGIEITSDFKQNGPAWADRDYTYDELLTRVFDIMRAKNPDMVAGEKKKFVMKPPQVLRIGTKKTSFANFSDICKILHRQTKHLLAFLLAELGTSGSVDGSNQLIIKGRFQQKQIENVLRRYIREYVTCHTCHSPDTILQKETRLFFLQCETCGSRCSVASIKSGFQAITSKRAALKNKQQ